MPTNKPGMGFILDTHVWLWLINGEPRLGCSPVLPTLNRAARTGAIKVSIISVWEVAMLEAKERIHLGMGCGSWVEKALAAPGISLVPITAEIAIAATRLPGESHGDPADRILMATARVTGGTLVTADSRILTYGQQGYISVLEAA